MMCPSCAFELGDEALHCRDCLWLGIGVDEDVALRGDEHLFLLIQACEEWLAERWTAEEFHDFLGGFTASMRQREGAIHAIDIPFGLEHDFAEEQEVGLQGVGHCTAALQRLSRLDEADFGEIVTALQVFHDGVAQVTRAMAINRRNRDRPLWA